MEAAGEALAADAELMKLKDRGDRRWFVNSQGQTFAVIEGPVEYSMGSPPDRADRFVSRCCTPAEHTDVSPSPSRK